MPPTIATISIVRNEADIVESFVRHHCALGMKMHFVLHRCVDNTKEILEKLSSEGLHLSWREYEGIAYAQGELLTEEAARLVSSTNTDWILPLDADEFLISTDGGPIGLCFDALPHDRAVLLPWRTYVPTPEDDVAESCPVRRIVMRRNPEAPLIRKVLIPAHLVRNRSWKIPTGSHALIDPATQESFSTIASASLALAHFPVRSSEQLIGKVLAGWASVQATPGREPERCYHWSKLVDRCRTGNGFSLGELRNVALTYAAPDAAAALPALVHDPIATTVTRPVYPIRPASPVRVLADAAMAAGALQGEKQVTDASADSGDALETFSRALRSCLRSITQAIGSKDADDTLPAWSRENPEASATACVLAMVHAAMAHEGMWSGTALTRRQTLATLCPPLEETLTWIPTILSANKLPFVLERAVQHAQAVLTAEDFSLLRRECRHRYATEDLLGMIASHIAERSSTFVAPSAAAFLVAGVHHFLEKEGGIVKGFGNGTVVLMDPWCGTGEIAMEMLRKGIAANIERGGNPDVLRTEILSRMHLCEHDPCLRSVVSVRMSGLLRELRMQSHGGEQFPLSGGSGSERLLAQGKTMIPVLCTALSGVSPEDRTDTEDALMQTYLHPIRKTGVERGAERDPLLRAMARIHVTLRSAQTSAGAILLPRSLLHGFLGVGIREALLEDFEQIRIVDLHGETPPPSADDEPIEGGDRTGTAALFLLRSRSAAQGVWYAEWKGMRVQKDHALLSRPCSSLPWQRIAPEKPGYVYLP